MASKAGWLWKGVFHPWQWFSLEQLDELASYGIEAARLEAAKRKEATNG